MLNLKLQSEASLVGLNRPDAQRAQRHSERHSATRGRSALHLFPGVMNYPIPSPGLDSAGRVGWWVRPGARSLPSLGVRRQGRGAAW